MAWEWVSPVAGATVAIAGIAAGVLTAWGGRRHTEKLARLEREEAHRRWLRDRRADAYLGMLDVAETTGLWIERMHPMIGSNASVPEMPDQETQTKAVARLHAYGSVSVKQAEVEWRGATWNAIRAAEDVSHGREGRRGDLEAARLHEHVTRRALTEAIAEDLHANLD